MDIILEGFQQGATSGTWRVADGGAPDAPPAELPPRTFPLVMQHKGVWFYLYAPVAEDWEPSQYARIFGVSAKQPAADPSDPHGARSPSNYPTYQGRIIYGDATFATEAELNAWRAGSGGGSGGSSAGTTPIESPTFVSGQATVALAAAVSRAFRIPNGNQIAFEIDVTKGNIRAALGEYQTYGGQYRMILSDKPFDFDAKLIGPGAGSSPSINGTVPPGKYYLNVILDASNRQGDTEQQFRISWYDA